MSSRPAATSRMPPRLVSALAVAAPRSPRRLTGRPLLPDVGHFLVALQLRSTLAKAAGVGIAFRQENPVACAEPEKNGRLPLFGVVLAHVFRARRCRVGQSLRE